MKLSSYPNVHTVIHTFYACVVYYNHTACLYVLHNSLTNLWCWWADYILLQLFTVATTMKSSIYWCVICCHNQASIIHYWIMTGAYTIYNNIAWPVVVTFWAVYHDWGINRFGKKFYIISLWTTCSDSAEEYQKTFQEKTLRFQTREIITFIHKFLHTTMKT